MIRQNVKAPSYGGFDGSRGPNRPRCAVADAATQKPTNKSPMVLLCRRSGVDRRRATADQFTPTAPVVDIGTAFHRCLREDSGHSAAHLRLACVRVDRFR